MSDEFARGAEEAGCSVEKIAVARKRVAVIDRSYAFFSQLAGKTFYFIISCAAPDEALTETMQAALRGFTCCVPDSVEGGVILGIGANDAGDVRHSPAMEQAYQMGRSLAAQEEQH